MEIFVLLLAVVPYFIVCRYLWHAGIWFKRHSRFEYPEED